MSECKIVLFGGMNVGKSALIIQFVQGYFAPDCDPTFEYSDKRILAVDNENVQLDIIDCGGAEDFPPLRTFYMRQCKGFILVYAIDDRTLLEVVEIFHRDLIRTKGTNEIPIVLCGNKCDLEEKRVVSKTEGEELSQRLNASFFETSALANINIENAFKNLVKQIKMEVGGQSSSSDPAKAAEGKKKHKRCLLL
jgi:small GTP-binding protein